MTDHQSPRHALPYLAVAQAAKEVTHNEALCRIDALLHPLIELRLAFPPVPVLADAGKCWLVAQGAAGEWQGYDNMVAIWTGGSWRFQAATAGMRVRNRQEATEMMWSGSAWISPPAIAVPQSGAVVDVEARAAIAALLSHFRTSGQLAS